eukprot:symbB.v1.2.001135.t1/scaffold62.1/size503095/1
MISVKLIDGRDVELSTADCSTFQNVSDKIHSTFGIKCDFMIFRTPVSSRVMEDEKVKDVLKHCTCFTTSLDYSSHKHTLTVVNALNRSHRVSLNMRHVESGHHLLRAIREHVLLGDVMTGFAVCWDGEDGRVVLRSDCSRFEGAFKLPLKFYTGEGMVMVASLLYNFMSAKPLEELFDKTPPSDGLCLLKDEVGSFEGYKVFYLDGDGDAHVATAYGCYQVNLEEFSRNHNVLILHDDECYKESLVKDLMEFLGYKVSCEMVVNVLSKEGVDFGSLPIIAMSPSDFTDKIQPFLETKDIQKLKEIKSHFMELLNSSAEKTDEIDESSGDDFIYTMEFDMMVAKAYGFEGECVSKNEKKDKVIIKPMYDTTKSIVLYYNAETTKVSQILDDLYDITELPRGAFDLLLKKTNRPVIPDSLLSEFEDDNGVFNFVIRLGGLKGGAGVINSMLKQKTSKKALLEDHAKKLSGEVSNRSYSTLILTDAQKFVHTLNQIDAKKSEVVFRQAVQNLSEDDLKSAIAMLDPTCKKLNGTEEKVSFFLELAMKERFKALDDHIAEVSKLKEAMLSRLLVLYGLFCGSHTGRYNNTPLMNMMIAQQVAFKSKGDEDGDESMEDLSKMMASTQL